jgi:hypothetical protein
MFYSRINKIKVFDNRERFLGLFNKRAEVRIYSYVKASTGTPALPETAYSAGISISELLELPNGVARKQRLLDAVLAEANHLAQSSYLEISGVKDNQSLLFGESGLVIFSSEDIPDRHDIQLWVTESDEDIRNFAVEADRVIESDAFKGLYAVVEATLAITRTFGCDWYYQCPVCVWSSLRIFVSYRN